MVDDYWTCDEAARRLAVGVERALKRADPDAEGVYASLGNALEYQLENWACDPATVRHLAQAVAAFAASRGIDVRSLPAGKKFDKLLNYEAPAN